jgi:hypothetical protein
VANQILTIQLTLRIHVTANAVLILIIADFCFNEFSLIENYNFGFVFSSLG